ncbi:HepT-like ribonuclease domain-containing protein [uncultured Cetobacterium sp.]|uniref:HepT-like ribonuclease domain-containing protein n=1 Tax=uncultured Cetobacterium sp. TaxID=527638 RepID=UPI0025CFE3ED|nr:HepT-like ribonuclease domain-containing protein [uncultured Cetobacterium sp.]
MVSIYLLYSHHSSFLFKVSKDAFPYFLYKPINIGKNSFYITINSYWEGIKGVRNRLIHEYWGTGIQMIYEISVDEMDELLDYIKKIRELEKNQIS